MAVWNIASGRGRFGAISVAALAITAWNLIATVARRSTEDIYLSNWYIIGGTLWTCILQVVAILPWYQHGLGQVSVSGFYMHNAVGMWFTPLALGILYYTVPKLLNRPIYSYALGVLAFWTNLVFYPIIGAHHFLFSPLPWWLQTTAIVFSVAMLVPVWGGSANFLLTMRGRVRDMTHSYPLMFIFVGVIGYLSGSTEGTIEAFRSLQEVWHLTNFTVGHSHLTMYGFVTFVIWGGVYALLPQATGSATDSSSALRCTSGWRWSAASSISSRCRSVGLCRDSIGCAVCRSFSRSWTCSRTGFGVGSAVL